ncbi:hypothetical protein OKA04_05150 [Luteolibacter flavescens]|uniref:Uncharacterized protein n=1 Tax=Luteolibacter flavescens TaxID=1859460 RepID=A0ABT3FLI4_9BACT|nr:hypothetical protein [Luteolibacter flavescens]MCW1884106.1 hypothetical protein [Luteolibacter flavescens]
MILLLVAAGVVHGSVTVGWKMPVERVAPAYAEAAPLAKPPGESAFFHPGDKLWDLSGVIRWETPVEIDDGPEPDPFAEPRTKQTKLDWKGDWIVWNERSGMIVARGLWCDVIVASKVLRCDEIGHVIRTRIEVKESKESRSLSLVSRNHEKALMETAGVQAEVDVAFSHGSDIADARVWVSWPSRDNRGAWEVISSAWLREGQSCRIARHDAGEQSWEVVISAVRELRDGTPLREFCWLEDSGALKAWPDSIFEGKPLRKQLGKDRWLGVFPGDQTARSSILELSRRHPQPDFNAPELGEWTRSPLKGISLALREQGMQFDDASHYAGFDPSTNTTFVVTDQENLDHAEGLFCSRKGGDLRPPIWIETNPESGGWGLACRTGEVAEIRRSSSNPEDKLSVVCSAIQSVDDVAFDVSYALDLVADGSKIGRLESASTLTKDKPQVIGSGTGPDGKEVKVSMTVSLPGE